MNKMLMSNTPHRACGARGGEKFYGAGNTAVQQPYFLPLNNPRRPSREAAKDGVLRNVSVIILLWTDKTF